MSVTVAALYVRRGGPYWDLEGVDPWDEERDARLYAGPHPVVAHPPCSRWCQLAHVNEARYGHRVGDDGGCFKAALEAVHKWGGVLEHPAYSYAWPAFGLERPQPGAWARSLFGDAWVTEVAQAAYGHEARKRTWLYYAGPEPPQMRWDEVEVTAQVSWGVSKQTGTYWKRPLSKVRASATPLAFRDVLLELARSAAVSPPDNPP